MSRRRRVEDGFGNCWGKCWRPWCGLEVVRPGKVQCWCDDGGSSLSEWWFRLRYFFRGKGLRRERG